MEDSRCIDNFRLAAGQKEGFREGWFFADSDAYKWLEASARVYASWPSDDLKACMDNFIRLVNAAQEEDGYIYTYNQIHFPGERWDNLMIEHELYCHGHLIEACVSHFEATHEESAFTIASKSADLLVKDFLHGLPEKTSGHKEVEIALLRLYETTQKESYLELARRFLERRGKVRPFAWLLLKQNARVNRRSRFVQKQRQMYLVSHPEQKFFQLPLDNISKKSWNVKWRWMFSAFSGKYFQQHVPIREQTIPVGHSVRFAYLETATAMLSRLNGDQTLLPTLKKAWERMVSRRMYITGGIGSLPELEGFGRDYELDPEFAYAETCAALGSLFWNWEMALIPGMPVTATCSNGSYTTLPQPGWDYLVTVIYTTILFFLEAAYRAGHGSGYPAARQTSLGPGHPSVNISILSMMITCGFTNISVARQLYTECSGK